jgi:hypothetical protein
MISIIWTFLTGNRIARTIGLAVMAVLGVLGYGKLQERRGAQSAKAKQAEAKAKADAQAHERMNDADLGIGATDSERIERLRDFAAKHGNRQAKGNGG